MWRKVGQRTMQMEYEGLVVLQLRRYKRQRFSVADFGQLVVGRFFSVSLRIVPTFSCKLQAFSSVRRDTKKTREAQRTCN